VPSAQEARWAAELTILAAEDNRLDLPAGLHTPVIDALRAKQDEEMRVLLTLTRSSDAVGQKRAMRALGRYENRAFSATLLQFLATGPARTEAAIAVVLSLRGDPLPIDRTGQQVQMAFELLAQLGSTPRHLGGDRFIAKPRRDIPETEKPTPAMRRAQLTNIKKAQAAVRKRRATKARAKT